MGVELYPLCIQFARNFPNYTLLDINFFPLWARVSSRLQRDCKNSLKKYLVDSTKGVSLIYQTNKKQKS